MTISTLPLSYCTNVHPGRSLEEVLSGLERYTLPIRQRCAHPIAAGLWLAHSVVQQLQSDPRSLVRLREWLQRQQLPCYTLNAFPYGDFHGDRVKEQVYRPDWTTPQRAEYTLHCARVLAELLPDNATGSLSTVPLGFKSLADTPHFVERCAENLRQTALALHRLHLETGRLIRLALEPEPLCVLETTAETVAFFRRLRDGCSSSEQRAAIETHLGVCFDVCHQAVEFEDVAASVHTLAREHIGIHKVHISCALHVDHPADDTARAALAQYIEPRYLHQTFARTATSVLSRVDLDAELTNNPPPEFRRAAAWRVHFHVPVDAEQLGPLRTTRPQLLQALAAVAELDEAPHLEVETYTWGVLPGGGATDLVEGIARELLAAHGWLEDLRARQRLAGCRSTS
jgi:hypothetical protein